MTDEELDEYAQQLVQNWPPLNPNQINRINVLMNPAPSGVFLCPKAA